MYKLAVIGSRGFKDYGLMNQILTPNKTKVSKLISGGAKGADSLAAQWAEQHDIPVQLFLPDWDTHGKGAGFKRNWQIVREADKVLAFWDGSSKGTTHSIECCTKLNKPYHVVLYNKS